MKEHVLDRIEAMHERLGTAGFVLSIIALCLALTGGAYAAGGGLTGKQKKEVKAIAKSFQGTGPAGAAGTNGTNGKDGAPGAAGDNGAPGTNGKSVAVTAADCNGLGGAEVKQEGAGSGTDVCNGEPGAKGDPWALDNQLPAGATETGIWSINTKASASGNEFFLPAVAISFPIPLAAALDADHIHFVTSPEGPCTGTAEEPTAENGHLCVYGIVFTGQTPLLGGFGTAGAFMRFPIVTEPNVVGQGSWAVTG